MNASKRQEHRSGGHRSDESIKAAGASKQREHRSGGDVEAVGVLKR